MVAARRTHVHSVASRRPPCVGNLWAFRSAFHLHRDEMRLVVDWCLQWPPPPPRGHQRAPAATKTGGILSFFCFGNCDRGYTGTWMETKDIQAW